MFYIQTNLQGVDWYTGCLAILGHLEMYNFSASEAPRNKYFVISGKPG